jgi:hypothetical protein
MANLFDHTSVIEGPGGAVSSHSALYLEYLCRWCGERVADARSVTVQDVDLL